ncbi:unnamed protein product [Amaranthus hypochondriacus]
MGFCYSGAVTTILVLQLLPHYSSGSALFQGLSARCRAVITDLSPCADFIKDAAALPEAACCRGIHQVANAAKSRPAVEEVCVCLKQGLVGASYDPMKLHQLPKICGANINFPPVNSNTDCTESTMQG